MAIEDHLVPYRGGGCISATNYLSARLREEPACCATRSGNSGVLTTASDIPYRRTPVEKILKTFEPWRLQALKADAPRLKRDRRTALRWFEEIQKQGFVGSDSRVSEFVRPSRERGDGAHLASASDDGKIIIWKLGSFVRK